MLSENLQDSKTYELFIQMKHSHGEGDVSR